jgi:hypothetical protein
MPNENDAGKPWYRRPAYLGVIGVLVVLIVYFWLGPPRSPDFEVYVDPMGYLRIRRSPSNHGPSR